MPLGFEEGEVILTHLCDIEFPGKSRGSDKGIRIAGRISACLAVKVARPEECPAFGTLFPNEPIIFEKVKLILVFKHNNHSGCVGVHSAPEQLKIKGKQKNPRSTV